MFQTSLLALSLAAAITPAFGAVHEKLAALPKGWAHAGSAADSTSMTLTIALNMQNIDSLESKLLSVSTPGSPNYGKYLDSSDVNSLFSPSKDAVNSVTSWLKNSGVKHYNVDGAFIDFATDVKTANSLLGANYQYYSSNGETKLRTMQYSVPDEVQQHVNLVMPATYFGNTKAFHPAPMPSRTERTVSDAPTKRQVDASCQTSITPQCLKELYNVGDYKPDPKSGSKIGFGSFLNQSALYSDVAIFEQTFNIPSQNFSVELIAGGVNDQNPPSVSSVGEADLDVENIIGIAHPLPVIEYITGGSP
jgi:tripeptidyl-peptidase I